MGCEFLVNDTTVGSQYYPFVAVLSNGGHVVVWESDGQDGDSGGIYGKIYDAAGVGGAEFRVNDITANDQSYPYAAGASDGRFIVVWESDGQDGDGYGIYGKIYDAVGVGGVEFRVNDTTAGNQLFSSAMWLSDGRLIVSWASYMQDGDGYGVYGKIYDIAGVDGPEFRINDTVANYQSVSLMANLVGGEYIIIWQSSRLPGGGLYEVYGKIYDEFGVGGAEFRINDPSTGNEYYHSVAGLAGGGFVVIWESDSKDVDGSGIYGRVYDGAGVGGAEFRVNDTTANDQEYPSVASLAGGGYVVVWESQFQDGDDGGVYGKIYDVSGVGGAEFRVNDTVVSEQGWPEVVGMPDGGYVVVWRSYGQDGDGYGIYMKLYGSDGMEKSCPPEAAGFAVSITGAGVIDFAPHVSDDADPSAVLKVELASLPSDGVLRDGGGAAAVVAVEYGLAELEYVSDISQCAASYSDSFRYKSIDTSDLRSAEQTVTINGSPFNCPPAATDFSVAIVESGVVEFVSHVSDAADAAEDLRIELVSLPSDGVLSDGAGAAAVVSVEYGLAELSYRSSSTQCAASYADHFTYKSIDTSDLRSAEGVVTINGSPFNCPPAASGFSVALTKTGEIDFAPHVSDIDDAAEDLRIELASLPSDGVLSDVDGIVVTTASGSGVLYGLAELVYTSDISQCAASHTDHFTYKSVDTSDLRSAEGIVTINGSPFNCPPAAPGFSVDVDRSAALSFADYVSDDGDSTDDLRIKFTQLPSRGVVTQTVGDAEHDIERSKEYNLSSIKYISLSGCSDTYEELLKYRIKDSSGLESGIGVVSLNVLPFNCLPRSEDFRQTIGCSDLVRFVGAGDSDSDGEGDGEGETASHISDYEGGELLIKLTELPKRGEFKGIELDRGYGPNKFEYTGHDCSASFVDSFSYVVMDGDGGESGVSEVMLLYDIASKEETIPPSSNKTVRTAVAATGGTVAVGGGGGALWYYHLRKVFNRDRYNISLDIDNKRTKKKIQVPLEYKLKKVKKEIDGVKQLVEEKVMTNRASRSIFEQKELLEKMEVLPAGHLFLYKDMEGKYNSVETRHVLLDESKMPIYVALDEGWGNEDSTEGWESFKASNGAIGGQDRAAKLPLHYKIAKKCVPASIWAKVGPSDYYGKPWVEVELEGGSVIERGEKYVVYPQFTMMQRLYKRILPEKLLNRLPLRIRKHLVPQEREVVDAGCNVRIDEDAKFDNIEVRDSGDIGTKDGLKEESRSGSQIKLVSRNNVDVSEYIDTEQQGGSHDKAVHTSLNSSGWIDAEKSEYQNEGGGSRSQSRLDELDNEVVSIEESGSGGSSSSSSSRSIDVEGKEDAASHVEVIEDYARIEVRRKSLRDESRLDESTGHVEVIGASDNRVDIKEDERDVERPREEVAGGSGGGEDQIDALDQHQVLDFTDFVEESSERVEDQYNGISSYDPYSRRELEYNLSLLSRIEGINTKFVSIDELHVSPNQYLTLIDTAKVGLDYMAADGLQAGCVGNGCIMLTYGGMIGGEKGLTFDPKNAGHSLVYVVSDDPENAAEWGLRVSSGLRRGEMLSLEDGVNHERGVDWVNQANTAIICAAEGYNAYMLFQKDYWLERDYVSLLKTVLTIGGSICSISTGYKPLLLVGASVDSSYYGYKVLFGEGGEALAEKEVAMKSVSVGVSTLCMYSAVGYGGMALSAPWLGAASVILHGASSLIHRVDEGSCNGVESVLCDVVSPLDEGLQVLVYPLDYGIEGLSGVMYDVMSYDGASSYVHDEL